jgi:PAS domain S-box-containing protein
MTEVAQFDPFGSELAYGEPDRTERQPLLREATSDLICASELGELGRMTFGRVSSVLDAVVCTNYCLDPAAQRLRLVFVHGIPPDRLEAARSLEVGQEYCGAAAASCQPLVADKQRIASDRNGTLVRELGATAYACYPLKASDGRLLGTFAVASVTREGFTDHEVAWLGTVTNFLAQAWERLEAEQGLRASEERLRLSQEAAGLGHWEFDFASGTLVWSEQTRKLLGVDPAEPASKELLLSRVHAEDCPRIKEKIRRSLGPDSDHVYHVEFRVVMQNDALRWLEDQGRVETNAAGMPVRAFGVIRDITARKNAEEAQARLAAIVTSSADAIIGKTLEGIVTSWNEAAERMFGYSADEMIGQSIRRLIPADRQPEEDMILVRLARSECIVHFETMRVAKDGRTFDASVTISPVRDAEGRVIGASKIIRDITDRKRTEARLAEREAQLAMFVEDAPAAIAMFDDKMRYLAVSRRYVSDFGLPPHAELIGRSHYEIFPDIPPRWREVHARVLAGEELAHEEDPFPRQDGRTDWCRWLMKPWRTADGRIGGALLFSEVITEQVAARRALAESEARFRATFENASVGIAHLAPDLRWLRANEALCRILGYPVDELVAKSLQDITHPDDLASDLAQVRRMLDGIIDSYDMDKRYLRKDGSIVWGRLTVGCVRKSDGSIDYFVSVVEDISARKAHEEQVHLLMREADHRAKNILSLVQAIARQTTAREPEDFIRPFTDRIQSLAANQDLLVRNEWKGVDVKDLVRAQLAHFAGLVGSRIAVHGPKLHLNAAAAQAIGLALHELATNASKYGALSVDTGRIDVLWRLRGDIFAMSWIERNGPPVSRPERRGFGSTVIASMAKRTVDGEVELDYAPSGLVWRLTCSATNALEPRERESNLRGRENQTDGRRAEPRVRTIAP